MPLSGRRYVGPDALARLRLPPASDEIARVRDRILTSAYLAGMVDRRVSYSRNRAWYAGRERYEGEGFTYRNVTGLVDHLVAETPWLTGLRARQGAHLTTGLQSTFTATPELMDAMSGVRTRYGLPDNGLVVLRNGDGCDVDYRDTQRTDRMRAEVLRINSHLRRQQVQIPGAQVRGDHLVMQGTRGEVVVTPHDAGVRRIFNRGSWTMGGRLYGWWQAVPKSYRSQMLLDGSPVAEPDFESLHAFIVYARAGLRFEGDAYDVGGGIHRDHAKAAFVIGINAETDRAALGALVEKLGCEWGYAREVYEAVKARHAPVASSFGADEGVRLMAIDGRIATRVLLECEARAMPVLPVHDSFVAKASDEAEMGSIMTSKCEDEFNGISSCRVRTYLNRDLHMVFGAPSALSSCPLGHLGSPVPDTLPCNGETEVLSLVVPPVACLDTPPCPEDRFERTSAHSSEVSPGGAHKPVRPRKPRRGRQLVDVATMPLPSPRAFVRPGDLARYETRCREVLVELVAGGCSVTEAIRCWRQSWEIELFASDFARRKAGLIA